MSFETRVLYTILAQAPSYLESQSTSAATARYTDVVATNAVAVNHSPRVRANCGLLSLLTARYESVSKQVFSYMQFSVLNDIKRLCLAWLLTPHPARLYDI